MKDSVLLKIENNIATVTINRPDALNALNKDVLMELDSVLAHLEQKSSAKVAVITGAGEKSFVAGADIAQMKDMSPLEAEGFSSLGQQVFNHLEAHPLFTIAAINGYALGGGCELAMACDIRIASQNARLGIPETTLGLIPGFGGTQRLPRLIGLGRAKEMLATGSPIKAEDALKIGLVNHVVEQKNLLPFCYELATKVVCNSMSAVQLGKQAMNRGLEMDQDKAMNYEAALFAMSFTTPDAAEGMAAFIEKRKPIF